MEQNGHIDLFFCRAPSRILVHARSSTYREPLFCCVPGNPQLERRSEKKGFRCYECCVTWSPISRRASPNSDKCFSEVPIPLALDQITCTSRTYRVYTVRSQPSDDRPGGPKVTLHLNRTAKGKPVLTLTILAKEV